MKSRTALIRLLQNAHAGELAAFHAYDGHARSVRDSKEKLEIEKIRDEEWVHRECVRGLLTKLGAGPRLRRELVMKTIGLTIGLLCRIGGWFIPMYGAGKLEAGNVLEYETAARLAIEAGFPEFTGDLHHMAEVEWDHEYYFRLKTLSHWAHKFIPLWKFPPPREKLRMHGAGHAK